MILKDGHLFTILLSSIVYFALFVYCLFIRKSAGIVYHMALMACCSLQGLLSIGELLADGLEAKLFWRNLQQIPLYGSSVMLLGVIMSYMRVDVKVRRRTILVLIAVVAAYWILLFTDFLHHLIRREVWVEPYGRFERIGMSRMPLGWLFYLAIHSLSLWGLALLAAHYRKVVGGQKRQVILLVIAILCPYLLPELAKLLGGQLNISTSLLPTAIIFSYVMYFRKFLQMRPLAREKVLEHMSEGILIADERDRIIDANPAARELGLGTGGKLVGASLADLFAGLPDLKAACASGEQNRLEEEIGGKWFDVRLIPLRIRDERTGMLLIFADITGRKRAERELIRRATTDGLTGLSNRLHFFEKLQEARDVCRSSGKPLSLMVIDLDHFKSINDRFGHAAGDRLLVRFADLLRDAAERAKCTPGRIGGEEFAVFCPGMDGEAAFRLAEEIRLRAAREPILLAESGEAVAYTVSIGIAQLRGPDMTVESLYAAADNGLYVSKASGGNRTTPAERNA
jgi:diguanylate cyclase (GGDEF)-like protein/PAS domain S-box-containing protein